MVQKKQIPLKVVLDTNVWVSSLLFKGSLNKIVDLWKTGQIIPIVSPDTFDEFRTVLRYPKFSLKDKEIKSIIEDDVLPYIDVVGVVDPINGACPDPDDDKFISCAVSASASYIVTGDPHLYAMKKYRSVRIIRPSNFLKLFE